MKPKITAKDFFLHVAILMTLYVSIVSLITLLVQTINAALPDAVEGMYYYSYQGYTNGMRFAVASLIIIFPVFVFLSWWNHRQIRINPELKELSIRKWFSYLTLFLAGATIIGDLIAFLNSFLGGEITLRFVLKVLAILLVSAFVFIYQMYELRGSGTRGAYRTFRVLAIVVVLASIIWSFFIMGSPMTARDLRFDERRVSDLTNIQWQIINFWQRKEKLPTTLTELNDPISGWFTPKDPSTEGDYEYRSTGVFSFELCATFTRENISAQMSGAFPAKPYPASMYETGPRGEPISENWSHSAGRACFSRTIDPELYPPIEKAR